MRMGRSIGARELMVVLDYRTWLKFKHVIEKAREACENSGHAASGRFVAPDQLAALENRAQR